MIKTFEFPEVYQLDLDLDQARRVRAARLIHGFSYRPVERVIANSQKTVHEVVYIVERICGLCSHSHTTAFCQAVEQAFGLQVPPRARATRSLVAELERLADHLLNLGEVAHLLGEKELFAAIWQVRNRATDLSQQLTGKRVHFGINRIGGVTMAPWPADLEAAVKSLPDLEAGVEKIEDLFRQRGRSRLAGRGVFKAQPGSLPGTGPNYRAFGDQRDVRLERPYAAYESLTLEPVVASNGDSWDRIRVRLGELGQSLSLIGQLAPNFPGGELADEPAEVRLVEPQAASSVEAPRGEDVHSVTISAQGIVEKMAVSVPTTRVIDHLERALIGQAAEDVDLIVASFDLCLACRDST
ncbi:MAG: nickel-dependent hydrogenase large subunit [Deltaproteobacteria bacterium]|nr:nickel-dependent hydrogenase large subunit [Deltaproteobacteria bacterium]